MLKLEESVRSRKEKSGDRQRERERERERETEMVTDEEKEKGSGLRKLTRSPPALRMCTKRATRSRIDVDLNFSRAAEPTSNWQTGRGIDNDV